MPLTYERKIYPVSWERPYTPPTPPVQYVEMSFDTSSQYITSKISPFTVTTNDTVTWDSYYPNTLIFDIGASFINLRFELADEWTSITGIYANATPMSKGVAMATLGDILFTPIVVHQIIHRDTQGPCPNGFHIGTRTEWANVGTIFSNLGLSDKTNFMNYFKAPSTYYLNRSTAAKNTSYGPVRFWTSTMEQKSSARCMYINEKSELNFGATDKPSNGFSIRPFKDEPVVPDLNDGWVQTFDGSSVASGAGIYRNSTLGLISMSSNGSKWITASDKNLGAANVGDNGLYYQFGNNYGFTENPSSTYTSTQDATGYGPGNYYNDSHFVKVSTNNWMSSNNNNIWGGVTNKTWTDPV